MLEAFRTGAIGTVVQRTVIPPADVPCSKWSLCNRVIVALSGTDDARGYRQWKDVGRYGKKGSKAIHILVPWMRTDPVRERTDGVRAKKHSKEDEGKETHVLRGFLAKPVFRYQDTDGTPIERAQIEPPATSATN